MDEYHRRDSLNIAVFIFYGALVAFVSLRTVDTGQIGSWDKVLHLGVYAVFAILAYRVFRDARQYSYLCIGIIVYSGLLEVAQSFVPGRFMSPYDLLANILGVLLGALVAGRLLRLKEYG